MPAVTTYIPTGNAYIDGLLDGTKWALGTFTFSFPASASSYQSGYGSGEPLSGFEALNVTQQAVARATLALYASVANLTFIELAETSTQPADLRFAQSDTPSTAWSYFPNPAPEGGDVWFNNSSGWYDNPVKGNYAYATFLHEIGHALGLKHPHEVEGAFGAMPVAHDSLEYSVMSYRSYVGASTTAGYTNGDWDYPQSLMMDDIRAVQQLYGANYATHSQNTTYSWSPTTGEMFINGVGQGAPGGNRIFLTVWDGDGVDTYDFSNYATNLKVDLQPGQWTTTSTSQLARLDYYGSNTHLAAGNIANALLYNSDPRSLIENAVGGSGHDSITGNAAANALYGGAGNDKLYGLAGDDKLTGGSGADTLDGGSGNDVLDGGTGGDRLVGGTGVDTAAYTSASSGVVADLARTNYNRGDAAGDTYSGIENLTGSAYADTLTGDNGANVITGGGGGDRLSGRGGADTFVFQFATDSSLSAQDTISDFVSGVDRIDLRLIDAGGAEGDQAFTFLGAGAFGRHEGELTFASGVLSGDVNGDAVADFQINIAGVRSLLATDFYL